MDLKYTHSFNYKFTVDLQQPILYLTIESVDNDMVRLFKTCLKNDLLPQEIQAEFKNINQIHNYLLNK